MKNITFEITKKNSTFSSTTSSRQSQWSAAVQGGDVECGHGVAIFIRPDEFFVHELETRWHMAVVVYTGPRERTNYLAPAGWRGGRT